MANCSRAARVYQPRVIQPGVAELKKHYWQIGTPVLLWIVFSWVFAASETVAIAQEERAEYIRANYTKFEYQVPMRDGAKLYTIVYVPNSIDRSARYPILLMRTPYSIGPYGSGQYRTRLGPNEAFERSGYIFAFQDVRGCYMSEGKFVNMRPHQADKSNDQVDESSDTYDTIEWLTKNVDQNNGRVGQWGISYPGFYTAAGAIDSHPALKCISPQAPIADWFWDDMHRNGAFNVQLAFTFFSSFGKSRPEPTTQRNSRFDIGTDDAYQFFLDLGSLKNVNEKYFHEEIDFWNQLEQHPNYDSFWQTRNLLPHLKNIHCASLVVGGWYDTEDLYGPLEIYRSIEANNPQIENRLVMGPWYHGGWNRSEGDSLGDADFGWPTAEWYRQQVELPFFEHHLKGVEGPAGSEATVFEGGTNRWRQFDQWPPKASKSSLWYLGDKGSFAQTKESSQDSDYDEFLSDPSKPVPYTQENSARWSRNYMAEDQRFVSRRPDVISYQTDVLEEDLTIAGEIEAEIWFSTTESDADLIVKVIDVFPGRLPDSENNEALAGQGGRQQLVRAQVMRCRFRNSFEAPEALTPDRPEKIQIALPDTFYTFQKGHRVMVQIQSSWFPFVDRNPQHFVPNIFEAEESDFRRAWHRVFHSPDFQSQLRMPILEE